MYPGNVRSWQQTRAAASRESMFSAARGLNRATRGLQLATGEFKAIDTVVSVAADTTSAVTLLNGCARGDDINERTGREVVMRSIQLCVRATVTAGTGIDQWHRYIVVYDRQTNGAALTFANVISALDVSAPRNLENRRRFTILMDKKFHLNATAESGSQRLISYYRRLRHPITFNNGDAGTVADITTGSLYLITYGSVAAGQTAGSAYGVVRVRYEDK